MWGMVAALAVGLVGAVVVTKVMPKGVTVPPIKVPPVTGPASGLRGSAGSALARKLGALGMVSGTGFIVRGWYTVQSDDTPASLAALMRVTVASLGAWNKGIPISTGQRIRVIAPVSRVN